MSGVIRVLVVDDSNYNRETIVQLLRSHPDFEVIATASDGEVGLKLALTLEPDLVTLDLEMPRMDGFTFLRLVMEQKPMPVLVVSSHNRAEDVFQALDLGAYDFVSKSTHFFPGEISARLRGEILRKAGMAKNLKLIHSRMPEDILRVPLSTPSTGVVCRVVCIGASTGGPKALNQLLGLLPAGGGTSYLIAQHMPESFTADFADRLNRAYAPDIVLGQHDSGILPGTVYIAPGGHHMALAARGTGWALRVWRTESVDNSPSVDELFRSVAREFDGSVLGIILTGMGKDGGAGLLELMEAGGHTVAESIETATVFGMPKEAIDIGAVKEILPLPKIGQRLEQFARGVGVRSLPES